MTGEATGPLAVAIDRDRCMGSGNCTYWAAEVFDLDEDLIVVVVGDPAEHRARVLLAAEHCPTNAIALGS